MSESKTYPVKSDVASNTWVTDAQYQEMYQRSIDSPDEFWADKANEFIDWFTPWDTVQNLSLIHI